MRHGMENGVSLMGGMRMMKSMFAVPQGANHFSTLSSKQHGEVENQSIEQWKTLYFLSCAKKLRVRPGILKVEISIFEF